jgi:hypothetical protein
VLRHEEEARERREVPMVVRYRRAAAEVPQVLTEYFYVKIRELQKSIADWYVSTTMNRSTFHNERGARARCGVLKTIQVRKRPMANKQEQNENTHLKREERDKLVNVHSQAVGAGHRARSGGATKAAAHASDCSL